jgi:bifunctional DNA-binding transcriptional regulator/antitoxin component of YhaV-PrlF toxin-antitoxin module
VKFGGKWLKDFGINVGDRLELIQGKNMLVLVKIPQDN